MKKLVVLSAMVLSVFVSFSFAKTGDSLNIEGTVVQECRIDSLGQIFFKIRSRDDDSTYTCLFWLQFKNILSHKEELWGKIMPGKSMKIGGKVFKEVILLNYIKTDGIKYPGKSFTDSIGNTSELRGKIVRKIEKSPFDSTKYQFTIERENNGGSTVCILSPYPAPLYKCLGDLIKALQKDQMVTVTGRFFHGNLLLHKIEHRKIYPKPSSKKK